MNATSDLHFKTCPQCGSQFSVAGISKAKQQRRKYCSVPCRGKAKRTLPPNTPRACSACGTEFQPSRKRGDARFCSKSCIWIATRGPSFNARIARETVAVRSIAMRGRGEGKSYRKLNGRHEHRVVAEQKLGRPLLPGEIVHHIDGNKLNNAPENLEIMTQSEHMRLHKPRLGTGKAHR